MYLYPENLKAKPMLWFWELQNVMIIGIGTIISILILSQTGFFVPIVIVSVYAFLAIKFDDTSILDFLKYACSYFLKQQLFEWEI